MGNVAIIPCVLAMAVSIQKHQNFRFGKRGQDIIREGRGERGEILNKVITITSVGIEDRWMSVAGHHTTKRKS